MPLHPVVDENDEIIYYKERADIDPTTEYRRVSALRLTNSRWEILIAQRSLTKTSSPGKRWPAVAGTVEKWESYEENIIKETQEEIWINNIKVTPWPKFKRNGDKKQFTQRFFATIDKDILEFTIQEEEVAAIKWISKEEIIEDIGKDPDIYIGSMKKYVEIFSRT